MKTQYVLGFMFDLNTQNVLLIEKTHPDWQKGKLNGIGGKINDNEIAKQAMIREFKEEVGIDTIGSDWDRVLNMVGSNFSVIVYAGSGNIDQARKMEEEQPVIVPLRALDEHPIIPNLKWIIPMCLDLDLSNEVQTIKYS